MVMLENVGRSIFPFSSSFGRERKRQYYL